MIDRVKTEQLRRGLCAAGLLAAAAVLSAPAQAGQCPADKISPGARASGEATPKDVTDTVLGQVELAKEKVNLADRRLRLRKLVVQPGGVVPWHSHKDRPAVIYVVSGAINEYASNCSAPIEGAPAATPACARAPPSQTARITAMDLSPAQGMPIRAHERRSGALPRTLLIGFIAFLTVIDLFGTQAILPALAQAYGVPPATMGFAVNATTMGMAVAGLGVAYFSRHIDRRRGILVSLTLLALPTALLAVTPNLAVFTALRIAQGLCMAAAFTLTLAYLGEHCGMSDAAGAFAAYITGNVASNLFGRLLAAGLADHLGLQTTFLALAMLNLAGAALVWFGLIHATPMMAHDSGSRAPLSIWSEHLKNPLLRPSFAIGFCILFAFIGTFTYVNFVLVREPLAVGPMALGFVYLVFAPSLVTTLLAGRAVQALGVRPALWGGLGVAAAGLPLLLAPSLPAVLAGLALIGIGTFFAQATATGFVNRAATDRGSASGIYLASYFFGGLVGSAVLGQFFDRWGWAACVAGIGAALAAAALLAVRLKAPAAGSSSALSNRQADGISVRSFDSA